MLWVDTGIWVIFCVDYFYGIKKAQDRKLFVKTHIIELIAILPFNTLLKSLRMMRLISASRMGAMLRLVRMIAYGSRLSRMLRSFFATHNFYLAVIFTVICVLLGAVSLSYFEKISIEESIWRSFLSTNGESGDSPITIEGRLVSSLLMITGAGFTGILTATVAAFFLEGRKAVSMNPHINAIIKELERFDDLNKSDVEEIARVLIALKSGT
jgi:voltage-gated potassium channel